MQNHSSGDDRSYQPHWHDLVAAEPQLRAVESIVLATPLPSCQPDRWICLEKRRELISQLVGRSARRPELRDEQLYRVAFEHLLPQVSTESTTTCTASVWTS